MEEDLKSVGVNNAGMSFESSEPSVIIEIIERRRGAHDIMYVQWSQAST